MHQVKKIATETDVKGKYVIVRASLNVPIENGVVVNQFRIARALPTLTHLVSAGARVILIAHVGRDPRATLKPVCDILNDSMPVTWSDELIGEEVTAKRNALKDGEVLMLENLRSDERETSNDETFAKELAALGDMYVCDAFAAGHREHASIVGIPKYIPGYAGVNFLMEYEELKRTTKPEHPSVFILGGAKFDTKMPLVEKFQNSYDHIFIGGALANDFFKAQGLEVGRSLVSDIDLSDSPLLKSKKIILPVDVVVEGAHGHRIVSPDKVEKTDIIHDVGPQTVNMLALYTKGAKTILWNGPLGNYENGHDEATLALARQIAESGAYSVVGGGDTVAAIEKLGLSGKFGFLSTGGGAMLSFLELGTLPAIEALKSCETKK